jgi:hypothetical protein
LHAFASAGSVVPVSRRRIAPAVLAVTLAMTVQAAHGAPGRVLAELHAARCCANTCHHARTNGGARECCGIGQDDPGVLAGAKVLPAPAATVAVDVSAVAVAAPTVERVADLPDARGRAAPVFLLTRTLRL